jgi:sulfatase maturation enzyme AslB (radical SAM superfamily)
VDKAEMLVQKESGCTYMFNERKVEQLRQLYQVFNREQSTIKFIINKMTPWINEEGKKIVSNEENQKDALKFTQKLLEFKEEVDRIIERAFENDMKFQKARDAAFQNFMLLCQKTPHLMAYYCDHEFQRGFRQMTDDQIDLKLDSIVRLFCCLNGRDQFIASYTERLA